MRDMKELKNDSMPEIVVHEYSPFYDSSGKCKVAERVLLEA